MAGHVSFSSGTNSTYSHLTTDADDHDAGLLLGDPSGARPNLGSFATVGESSAQVVTIPPGRTSLQDTSGLRAAATAEQAQAAAAPMPQCQQDLDAFWPKVNERMKNLSQSDFKVMELPLARIKKIMKQDDDVRHQMISAEVPMLFSKAAEIFISELTLRSWIHTEDNKRRTLQRNDIALAVGRYDQFDFLIDIVPREDWRAGRPRQNEAAENAFACYFNTLQSLQQQYNPQGQGAAGDGTQLDPTAISQLLHSLQTLSSITALQRQQQQQQQQHGQQQQPSQQPPHHHAQHHQLQTDDHEVAQSFQADLPASSRAASNHASDQDFYTTASARAPTPILDVVGDDDASDRSLVTSGQLPQSAGAHFVHQITSSATRSAASAANGDNSDFTIFSGLS